MSKITAGVMQECLNQCLQSTYTHKIGAVIFKSKRILSSGHNAIRTSSIPDKYKQYKCSIHAEQAALLNLEWKRLKGMSILVLKVSAKLHKLGNAKPCLMCQRMLNHVGIKHIWYSNEKGEIVKLER